MLHMWLPHRGRRLTSSMRVLYLRLEQIGSAMIESYADAYGRALMIKDTEQRLADDRQFQQ